MISINRVPAATRFRHRPLSTDTPPPWLRFDKTTARDTLLDVITSAQAATLHTRIVFHRMNDSTSAGPSTAHPSPTSTVYQPDVENDTHASHLPDTERDAERSGEKGPDRAMGNRSSGTRSPTRGDQDKEKEDWVVKWDGPDDPGCPLNTPPWRKWYV